MADPSNDPKAHAEMPRIAMLLEMRAVKVMENYGLNKRDARLVAVLKKVVGEDVVKIDDDDADDGNDADNDAAEETGSNVTDLKPYIDAQGNKKIPLSPEAVDLIKQQLARFVEKVRSRACAG